MNSGILKFTADYLHDGRSFSTRRVVITDEKGKILDLVGEDEAGEGVQAFEGILCPGFINAHCHLELSHLRGVVPEHTGLVEFLAGVMKCRDHAEKEMIVSAAEEADRVMCEDGIVAVGDIANTVDSITIKEKSRLLYHTFSEAIGFSADGAGRSMDRAAKVYQAFQQHHLAASVVPHAPYSVSGRLFRMINDFDRQALVSIHNQECAAEDALYLGEASDFYRLYEMLGLDYGSFMPTGYSSLKSWLPFFSGQQRLILVHNTYTGEEDMTFAAASGHDLYWCLCPNANAYIENSMPPVMRLAERGAQIVLGTDSLASNHQLSVLEEIKTLQQNFSGLPLETMLSWATLNGARALDCADELGSLRSGSRPGLVNLCPVGRKSGNEVGVTSRTKAVRVI